jgi:ATP-dependent RNA helicase RhlE
MFSQLGLSPAACAPLPDLGYTTPTPIQARAIPLVLSGVDLLARAETGTGKTAAFGLPLIDRLRMAGARDRRPGPRALVLVPTRELAAQVHQSLCALSKSARLRIVVLFGGVAMGAQNAALRQGADVIVATPGRLIDHLQRRTVDLSAIQILVLDEADRMMDMGFLPALRRLAAAIPRRRQTLLFSATLSDAIVRLSTEFTRDPMRVDVAPQHVVAATVTHRVHHVTADRKRDVLTHILTEHGADQALVFCRTKRGANRVGESLAHQGVRAGVIHGNKSQGARTRALTEFKTGRLRVLVATDIAARGLDITNLPLVVNFDLPLVPEDYVHRVGRTGRSGQSGCAVSLVTTSETALLRAIQQVVKTPIERISAPPVDVPGPPVRTVHPMRNRPHGPVHRLAESRRRSRRPLSGGHRNDTHARRAGLD